MTSVRHLPEPRTLREKLRRVRWTLARRVTALGLLTLMAASARFGWTWLSGDLSASLWLGAVHLSDPFAALERLAAGMIPTAAVLSGAGLALLFYALVGSRAFCGWVCPMNAVTETATWFRKRLGLTADLRIPNGVRYALCAGVLLASAVTGSAAFEPVSPQGLLWRDVVWGTGLSGLSAALGLAALEIALGPNLWCSKLCPLGAFWAVVGRLNPKPLVRIRFVDARCTRCGDCLRVCPEQQILKFKTMAQKGAVPTDECLLCGRCTAVCPEDALRWSTPLHRRPDNKETPS